MNPCLPQVFHDYDHLHHHHHIKTSEVKNPFIKIDLLAEFETSMQNPTPAKGKHMRKNMYVKKKTEHVNQMAHSQLIQAYFVPTPPANRHQPTGP